MTSTVASDSLVRPLDEESVYDARQSGVLSDEGESFTLIDLFAGAGGLTLGFTEEFGHTFRPAWANDWDAAAAATYSANFGTHCFHGDIHSLFADPTIEIPEADLVIGGPPCQGFSLLNKQRNGDARRELWRPFLEVVSRAGARAFLMENVPQLLGSHEHRLIQTEAEALGFRLASAKLLAADYGVPQTRTRAFILGVQDVDPHDVFPPKKTHLSPDANSDYHTETATPWRTVRDAIDGLPAPVGVEIRRDEPPPLDLHFGRNPTAKSMARYRTIPEEGMNRFDLQRLAPHLTPDCWIRKKTGGTDLFGRLWWDRPAFTIRTEFFKPEKGRYLHPVEHRPITHREAARFQTFPDSFKFRGKKIEIARQIGNAVPPSLAARIADSVYAALVGSGVSP